MQKYSKTICGPEMSNIAIIPARGGSKGVLKKNLKKIGGRTLVERSVDVAIDSALFDNIIVSTDCEEIAANGSLAGATIVWRPAQIANDSAKTIDAVIHALDEIVVEEGVVCLLQPTSPLRKARHLREAYELQQRNKYGSLISVTESEHHPYKTVILKEGVYQPVLDSAMFEMPRQELDKAFRINGAVYMNDIRTLRANRGFFGGDLGFYVMDGDSSIDIDSEIDLTLAEYLLKENAE